MALGAVHQAPWALFGTEEPPACRISGSRALGAEAMLEVRGAYRELLIIEPAQHQ